VEGKKMFSGRAAISSLFPVDFEYNNKGVTILEGILISGVLTKSHVGPSSRSITQELVKHYSLDRGADFLTDAPHLLNIYIVNRGFTVGINDCVNMVVDSKAELYNKKYNKNTILFQEEYEHLKEIVYDKKSYQNIKSIYKQVDSIINLVISNSNDISFNKIMTTQLQAFNYISYLIDQVNRCEDDKFILSFFQTFFKSKMNFKNNIQMYIEEFKKLNFNGKITEELYIKLKRIINSITVSYLLTGQDVKQLEELTLKINPLEIAKDVDSINQVIYNTLETLNKKPSKLNNIEFDRTLVKFENLLKKYKQEGISNVYYYNQFKELQKKLSKPYQSVTTFLQQPFIKKLWISVTNDIIETSEPVESLYEKIMKTNSSYENEQIQFTSDVYDKLLQCDGPNFKNATLGIFNEKLFMILALVYKNLVNSLNQEYNKNFIVKKEELAKVLLDIEAIGSKKGLSQQEQNYKETLIMEKVNVAKSIGVILAKNAAKSNAIIAQTEEGAGTN